MKLVIIAICFLAIWSPSFTQDYPTEQPYDLAPCTEANAAENGKRVICAVVKYKKKGQKRIKVIQRLCDCAEGINEPEQGRTISCGNEQFYNDIYKPNPILPKFYCMYNKVEYVNPERFKKKYNSTTNGKQMPGITKRM